MAEKKTIFIAFAIEDESQRNLLKGQSLNTDTPFEFIDMSVKDPYDSEWQKKVRTRIKRSDGVIALISESSLSSSGEKWEVNCADDEGVTIRGLWAYTDDRTEPDFMEGHRIMTWTWKNIENFIDSL